MKSLGAAILVLFCCLVVITADDVEPKKNEVQENFTEQTCQPYIQTVLREMSVQIAEQQAELRYTKAQLQAAELKVEATVIRLMTQLHAVEMRLMAQVQAVESRLQASEKTAEEQRGIFKELAEKQENQTTALAVAKGQVEAQLKTVHEKAEAVETRLGASERTAENQKGAIKKLTDRQEKQAAGLGEVRGSLNLRASQVEELRRDKEDSRVCFSAGLGFGYFGPFSFATPLVFKNVITNIGGAYNANTGVFTAPVRGVYHFVFFVLGESDISTPTGASLHHNDRHVVLAYEKQRAPTHLKPANGASLLLEVGDAVQVKLWPNAWVMDNQFRHTTFSGHLLFTL